KEVPSTSDFIRRDQHGAVAIGDFLYIDGGQLSQNISGELDTIVPRVNNVTLSIDLRTSWTNGSVSMTEIDRGDTPIFTFPSLWADQENSAFYLWDGMRAPGNSVPNLGLWKFTADNAGSGTWSKVGQRDLAAFNNLTRPVGGYSAVLADTAYYAGGFHSSATDPAVDTSTEIPVPGIVSYNFTSGAWANESAAGFTQFGTQMWGKAAAVPFRGGDGLIVFMGGESGSQGSISNANGQLDLDTIAVYDPSNSTWYSQVATGDVPSTRDGFCLVGAQDVSAAGTNGSYELFLFGGWNAAKGETYNDTYVLSLPAFRWFKGPDAVAPRINHACSVVGSGRRQFVSVGGSDNSLPTAERWTTADPWKQGLGVFDMTEMAWSDGYSADADAYQAPQVVRQWYQSGNAEPAWSDGTVQALFANATTRASVTTSDPSPSSTAESSPSSSGSSSDNTGAIVGGVVGGVVGLALILTAIFLLRRRRHRNPQATKVS
ncbi:hypothetical protein B0J12DRAFT_557101, partial [Macrophomina phaseolina]